MNKLPVEIQNKIWSLYYSNIYYTNVILELNKRIQLCNNIVTNEIRVCYTSKICILKYYNKELLKIYEKDGFPDDWEGVYVATDK